MSDGDEMACRTAKAERRVPGEVGAGNVMHVTEPKLSALGGAGGRV
jgi:hypothetical protein